MALRTVQQAADQKGKPAFLHFKKPTQETIKQDTINVDLNKIMQNVGGEAFELGTLKNAYDSDPRVKEMINDFNEDGITLKTKQDVDKGVQGGAEGGDDVSQMAQRATNLGSSL